MEVLAAIIVGIAGILGGGIGIAGTLLANRQSALIANKRSEADRLERDANYERDRKEAVRQEQLTPYRALRTTVAEIVGTAIVIDQSRPTPNEPPGAMEWRSRLGVEHRELHRRCMALLSQINDEEISDLVTEVVKHYQAWTLQTQPETATVKMMMACQDLSDGIDRILAGGRQYMVPDPMGKPVPARRNELP